MIYALPLLAMLLILLFAFVVMSLRRRHSCGGRWGKWRRIPGLGDCQNGAVEVERFCGHCGERQTDQRYASIHKPGFMGPD